MDRKKISMLLALLVIIAALMIPPLLHDQYPDTGSLTGNTVSQDAAQSDGNKQKDRQQQNPTGMEGAAAAEHEGQLATTQPDQVAAPADSTAGQAAEVQGCQIGIAVVGKGGELLYMPANVRIDAENKWGITALGALEATGLEYAVKPMWPDFVDSICGQACQGVSGWMYMVNGEIPMHLADKHPVKEGDQVIWWYSESMDQTPPVWDELTGGRY